MNSSSTNIGEICRSILRQRCEDKIIPSNSLCSPYFIDRLCLPVQCPSKPSCATNLFGLNEDFSTMKFVVNGKCQSIISDKSIQMICQTILDRVHCQIPDEDFALLCYSLPLWIREIMCKSPWLTPTDLIQWMSNDIINEAKKCFSSSKKQIDRSNIEKNESKSLLSSSSRSEQRERSKSPKSFDSEDERRREEEEEERGEEKEKEKDGQTNSSSKFKSNPDERKRSKSPFKNDSPSSPKKNRSNSDEEIRSNSSRKEQRPNLSSKSRKRSNSDEENRSNSSPKANLKTKSKENRSNSPFDEEKSEEFSTNSNGNDHRSKKSPMKKNDRIEFPGVVDRQAGEQVKKCWQFYQQMREHFDDDIAAMLFKCCLCYGNCSTKN